MPKFSPESGVLNLTLCLKAPLFEQHFAEK